MVSHGPGWPVRDKSRTQLQLGGDTNSVRFPIDDRALDSPSRIPDRSGYRSERRSMVLYSSIDRDSSIYLFIEHQPRQLVAQDHRPKGQTPTRSLHHLLGQTEVRSDQENNRMRPLIRQATKLNSELFRARHLAPRIECNRPTGIRQSRQHCLTLGLAPREVTTLRSCFDPMISNRCITLDSGPIVFAQVFPGFTLMLASPQDPDLASHSLQLPVEAWIARNKPTLGLRPSVARRCRIYPT